MGTSSCSLSWTEEVSDEVSETAEDASKEISEVSDASEEASEIDEAAEEASEVISEVTEASEETSEVSEAVSELANPASFRISDEASDEAPEVVKLLKATVAKSAPTSGATKAVVLAKSEPISLIRRIYTRPSMFSQFKMANRTPSMVVKFAKLRKLRKLRKKRKNWEPVRPSASSSVRPVFSKKIKGSKLKLRAGLRTTK